MADARRGQPRAGAKRVMFGSNSSLVAPRSSSSHESTAQPPTTSTAPDGSRVAL